MRPLHLRHPPQPVPSRPPARPLEQAVGSDAVDGRTIERTGEQRTVPSALSILIVDGSEPARNALRRVVAELGHASTVAKSGMKAWEAYGPRPFDVVLCDWALTEMSGAELCSRIREHDAGNYTSFLFTTDEDGRDHYLACMRAGADDLLLKPVEREELQARFMVAARVTSLCSRLTERNAELRRDSEHSFRVARVDPLTEAGNRLRLQEDLETLHSRAARYGHRYCVALCDIDFFKRYNDTFGHLAGDEALRIVSNAIRDQLRRGDSFYRYGGEEFLVILPEQSLAEATAALERVRRAVEALVMPHNPGVRVTISVGIAELARPPDASDKEWLQRADRALYRAKDRGRNRVETEPP